MGLFGWVMKGLGYEDKGDKKDKKNKANDEDKYANFNLHEKVGGNESTPTPVSAGYNMNGFGMPESNIIMFSPKSQSEMQQVIDYLKQGQSVAVNLEEISSEDCTRVLDFFSGAIYALNGSITRWKGDLFLLTPEGRKILKPKD